MRRSQILINVGTAGPGDQHFSCIMRVTSLLQEGVKNHPTDSITVKIKGGTALLHQDTSLLSCLDDFKSALQDRMKAFLLFSSTKG